MTKYCPDSDTEPPTTSPSSAAAPVDVDQSEVDVTVRVARDLREIINLSGDLRIQAKHKATDHLMPGGIPMVMLGPAASPAGWEARIEAAEAEWWDDDELDLDDRPDLTNVDEDEDPNWEPPLQTLLFWSEPLRAKHGKSLLHTTPTVNSEALWLSEILNWIFDNEPRVEIFAKEINHARLRLENTLYAGRRAERTQVPCIDVDCNKKPLLIKVYTKEAANDHYKCPSCKRRYNPDQFTRAKHHKLASDGSDRHVKMQDARDAIDRPERTFRKWLRYWYVRSYTDEIGQIWVYWPDVREMDLSTPRRNPRTKLEGVELVPPAETCPECLLPVSMAEGKAQRRVQDDQGRWCHRICVRGSRRMVS